MTISGHQIILSDSAKWYCVVTRSNQQSRAVHELGSHGFRAFYPKARKWASHARVKRAVDRPVLGRYVFVEVDHPRQSFATVRDCRAIESLLSNLGSPVAFPSHWIEGLLQRYLAGEWDEVAKGKMPIGARIRIIEGEFNDMCATVMSNKGRKVSLKLLGQNQYVNMHECSVRAA